MMYELVPNSCRVCLRKCPKLRSIYKPLEEDDEPPNEMLKVVTGIFINKSTDNGKLPNNICKDCLLSLNIAYEFRAKAMKSETIIETFLKLQSLTTSHEDAISDDPKIEYLQEDFEAIYDSVEQEKAWVTVQEEYIENDNIKDTLETNDSESDSEDNFDTFFKTTCGKARKTDDESKPRSNRGRKKMYDLEAPEPKDIEKLKSKSGHKYICDICGNTYAQRFRMMEHRQGHDKEMRHTCELCGKRFHLRERLRKHMYAHKNKRPHKCSYCSRTFFFESLKRTHEAVHLGAKPHACEVCDKTFAYSQALKNHKLIHAEIKLYHCKYCDKDFRLQHHMKNHEETKLHQNAVKLHEESMNADA